MLSMKYVNLEPNHQCYISTRMPEDFHVVKYEIIDTLYRLYPLMAVEALEYLKRELEKISDEATTDCYNEYDQIAGWCAYLEDKIHLPCKCKVNQKEGLLIGFEIG